MPTLITFDHTQRGVQSPVMHPIKALAFMCVGLFSLSYALPAPSDMTVSFIRRTSNSTAPGVEYGQENSEQSNVQGGRLPIGLRV